MFRALEEAFDDYRTDLANASRRQKVTDGLFGFGHSLKDDACHDRFDERVARAVRGICALEPTPEEAEKAVRMILCPAEERFPQETAKWMLRAVERHAAPLIPFLDHLAAAGFLREYACRYPRWDRLPVQKEIFRALKMKAQRGEGLRGSD